MEKIKEFWNQFYSNKKLFWGVIGGAVALLVIVGIILAVVLGGGSSMNGCTVTVKTEGGKLLEGIGVYVYTDEAKSEMVSFVKTDAEGKAVIDCEVLAGSVAVLEGVPAGYVTQESYPITAENTEIVLEIELLKEMAPITLGGVMFDFAVTDTDGTEHTLSKLLEEKDAVVLNLWYTNCGPCKTEFPYLQEAYDSYNEKVALLALNPVAEDDEEAVKNFKSENGLTFPMAKCEAKWVEQIEGIAYPTTVVIDRFGTVALIHIGSIDNTKIFTDAFAYFTAEDYVQTAVSNIADLKTEAAPSGEGTEENPLEFGGVTEFEVTVKPGEKVYCDVYKVSGMILKIESAAATVTYNGTEHTPKDGVIELAVTSEDTFTPVKLAIGNTAAEEKTFKVTFSFLPGTRGNPIPMELGALAAKVEQGNDQGVYYLYKSTETGILTLECVGAPKDVNYDFTLYNLMTYKMLTYGENGFLKEGTNNPALSIPVNAGDEVQIIIATLPNEENVYPAADLTFATAFEKGEPPVDGGNENSGTGNGGTSNGGTSNGGTGNGGSTGNGGTGNGSSTGNGGSAGTLSGQYEELYVGNAYYVNAGETQITLASGQVNYFLYTPTEAGKYSVKIGAGKLSYWGGNTAGYIADASSSESILERNSTSFTLNFMKGQVGSVILIGVEGTGTTTLTITRVGNSIEEKPWTVYGGLMKPTSQFTYTGGTLRVVDITGSTVDVVAGSDGYYHWGSASGPVVYVKLNDKTESSGYLSFEEWLTSEHPVIRAAVGSGSSEKKWDFTSCMQAYNKYKDKNTGYYPLNEDLKFILQTLYVGSQWKSSLFGDVRNLNEDMAWMFCCYYEG